MTNLKTCPKCEGTGETLAYFGDPYEPPTYAICPECSGDGDVHIKACIHCGEGEFELRLINNAATCLSCAQLLQEDFEKYPAIYVPSKDTPKYIRG